MIKRIAIKDFITFEDVDVTLNSRVFFIRGVNEDQMAAGSNGAGKSAFLQAISWCLFEDVRSGVLKDDVIRRDKYGERQPYAQVIVEIQDYANRHIVIDRVRNHPTRKHNVQVTIDGVDAGLHSASETNELIEKILGLTKTVFFQACFADELVQPFVSLTPAAMMTAVSDILGLSVYDEWAASMSADKKTAEKTRERLENDYRSLSQRIDDLESNINVLQDVVNSQDGMKQAQIEKVEQRIAELKEELEQMNAKAKESQADYDAFLLMPRDHEEKIQRFTEKLEKAKHGVKLAQQAEQEVSKKGAAMNKDIALLRAAFENLASNTSGKCTYCGGYLSESPDFAYKLDDYTAKLAKQDEAYLKIEAKLIKLRKDTANKLVKVESNERSLRKYNQEARVWQAAKFRADHFLKLQDDMKRVAATILREQERIEEIRTGSNEKAVQELKNAVAKYNQAVEQEEQSAAKVDEAVAKESAITVAASAVALAKKGRLSSFITNLTGEINRYLSEMTQDDIQASLGVKRDQIILTFSNSSVRRTYASFSRGERTRIAKAVQLALASVINPPMLLDDEGLSGLDKAGVDAVMQTWLETSAPTLFFVSHDSTVNEYMDKHSVITITKRGGVSTVTIEEV